MNGKGSKRRPSTVEERELEKNWCRIFGHRVPEGWSQCVTCGWEVTADGKVDSGTVASNTGG